MSFNCKASGCTKQLSSKYNLKRHIECCHQGLRRFQCDVCFKLFSSKQNVKEHMFLHEQEEEDNRSAGTAASAAATEITIPLLTDMIENSDDYELKPFVTVVHIYPYIVNSEEAQSDDEAVTSDDEQWSASELQDQ